MTYLKAIPTRKRDELIRKGGIIVLAILLAIILIVIGSSVIKAVSFNKSLPNPEEATVLSMYKTKAGSVVFSTADFNIVSIAPGAKYNDYLSYCNNSHVNVIFLRDCTETGYDNMVELHKRGSFSKIYLPKNASKDFVKRLKRHFPDVNIEKLKSKGEKFVLGEMVVRVFDSVESGFAFSVTHGFSNFLVADENSNVKALKDKEISVLIGALEPAKDLQKVDYYISTSDNVDAATASTFCMQYCVPGSRVIYGIHDKELLEFDVSFDLTGKLQ